MTRHIDIAEELLAAIASGELAPGAAMPSVRALASERGTTPSTVGRAYAQLAAAGAIVGAPRRRARVAANGAVAARRRLHGERVLRLAGSDDPLLDLVAAGVERLPGRGSFSGLTALWRGDAQAATLHLGDNAPFAARVLAGRRPVLVSLWRREQGIVVPAGNPRGIGDVEDLVRVRTALRRSGTGTRALMDRALRARGADPDAVRGPVFDSHLEVALAVAAGIADAGVAVRGAAVGLDFVPLAWEPFDLALGAGVLDDAAPLLAALGEPGLGRTAAELGGYDLEGAGRLREL